MKNTLIILMLLLTINCNAKFEKRKFTGLKGKIESIEDRDYLIVNESENQV